MNTVEAIRIFEVVSTDNIDETVIKKKYRELMKRIHPDNVDNTSVDVGKSIADLKMAKDILIEYAKCKKLNESKYRKKTYFVNVSQLQMIYDKEEIQVGGDTVTRSDLTYNEVYLELIYEVNINGLSITSRSICHHRSNDIYDIYIDIPSTDCADDSIDVSLTMEGVSLNVSLGSVDIIRILQYGHDIKVMVHLNKIKARSE